MDLESFSKDDFDPKEWINKTFQNAHVQENKEEYATTVIAKLQSFIQEVNVSLEKTAEQVNQNLPRIAREIEVMQNEARLLQQQMGSVKGDVMKVERDSSQSMQILLKIDHVKSCMQDASKALREADNWTTLSTDVEKVFQTGDIDAIAAKLVGMQNSLEILADVPDYQDRCSRLENLKDRLEAMISPRLIAAFNSQNIVTDVSLMYMKIFKDLRRLSTLQKHYHTHQKNHLLQQWKQIVENDPDETLVDWLNNFHDLLLSTWHSQITCCQQLLPEVLAVEVLSELLVDVLTEMEPPLSFCIDAGMKIQSNPLQYLIELKQITDRLAKSLEISIHAIEPKFLNDDRIIAPAKAIYAPYCSHIEKYDVLEEQLLKSSLKTIGMPSEELEESVRHLNDSISKVFCFIHEAEERCQLLTQGCGYHSFLRALESFLSEYASHFRCVLRLFRKHLQSNADGSVNKWTLFYKSVHTTQILGEALIQLENFEISCIGNIREAGRKVGYYSSSTEEKSVSPFHQYDNILLSTPAKKEFQLLIKRLQAEKIVSPFAKSITIFKKLCSDAGSLVSDMVLQQAQIHLKILHKMPQWSEENNPVISNLPQFSFSPQEYITEVGQYLMTIPQYIAPFITPDDPALQTALKNCNMPGATDQDGASNVADYLLECLAKRVADFYYDSILKIQHLSVGGNNQLQTDIKYFCDVLEDLGLPQPSNMQDLLLLLSAKPEAFKSASKGKSQTLTQKVSLMRKL